MATNAILSDLFTDITMQKAADDLLAQHEAGQQHTEAHEVEHNEEEAKETQTYSKMDKERVDEDEGDSLEAIKERRIQQMKDRMKKRNELQVKGHGKFEEIVEDEFLKAVTGSQLVACHFYHKEFERCKIMDMHLAKMAPSYVSTRFIKINSEKTPFFVRKLAIRTLPTVVLFVDGIAVHHIVGFAEMGVSDSFPTARLARVMKSHGLIKEKIVECDSDSEEDN
eukprot:GDKI01018776.1.p1 GENE.GDKI01018776.1~~GDKI01018776.1.p1  ORF type:complete len:224 (-),score=82.67 GDKI01018776.1:46-717(-)